MRKIWVRLHGDEISIGDILTVTVDVRDAGMGKEQRLYCEVDEKCYSKWTEGLVSIWVSLLGQLQSCILLYPDKDGYFSILKGMNEREYYARTYKEKNDAV